MNEMMNAITFSRYGEADVLEHRVVPRPALAPDALLLRVAAAGVNPADWVIRSGQLRLFARLKFPFIPGADVAGIIEAIGANVTRFRPGDAVYAMLPNVAGGGYAEYAAVREDDAALIPPNLTFTEAAAVPLAALTALQALRDHLRLTEGMTLLVNGASGGVGTFGVQLGKLLGARVTAVTSGRNLDFARTLGADEVLDYTRDDVTAGTTRYDAIFDAVGTRPLAEWARILAPKGAAVTVNPTPTNPLPLIRARLRGQRLGFMLVRPSGADLMAISGGLAAERLRPVVEQVYRLDEAAHAQRQSETRRVRGKLVLAVDGALAGRRAQQHGGQFVKRGATPALIPA
jgi:NADPH:quinone reductase-like Zn-dependent oxidoreductase